MEEEREARGVSTFPADSLYLQPINITQEVGHTHFEADKDPTQPKTPRNGDDRIITRLLENSRSSPISPPLSFSQPINTTQEVGHTHFEADKDPTKIKPNPRPHEPNTHFEPA